MSITATDSTTRYLDRPSGRIAYSLLGDGPLVICLPGMGDVRSVYRSSRRPSPRPASVSLPWTFAVTATAT